MAEGVKRTNLDLAFPFPLPVGCVDVSGAAEGSEEVRG